MVARSKVDVQYEHGVTSLHWAAMFGNAEMASHLLAARAKVDVRKDDDGLTPLHYSTFGSQSQC